MRTKKRGKSEFHRHFLYSLALDFVVNIRCKLKSKIITFVWKSNRLFWAQCETCGIMTKRMTI